MFEPFKDEIGSREDRAHREEQDRDSGWGRFRKDTENRSVHEIGVKGAFA